MESTLTEADFNKTNDFNATKYANINEITKAIPLVTEDVHSARATCNESIIKIHNEQEKLIHTKTSQSRTNKLQNRNQIIRPRKCGSFMIGKDTQEKQRFESYSTLKQQPRDSSTSYLSKRRNLRERVDRVNQLETSAPEMSSPSKCTQCKRDVNFSELKIKPRYNIIIENTDAKPYKSRINAGGKHALLYDKLQRRTKNLVRNLKLMKGK